MNPSQPITNEQFEIIKLPEYMTLRDYFAAKAMQASLIDCLSRDDISYAKLAYEVADAMLAERNK